MCYCTFLYEFLCVTCTQRPEEGVGFLVAGVAAPNGYCEQHLGLLQEQSVLLRDEPSLKTAKIRPNKIILANLTKGGR